MRYRGVLRKMKTEINDKVDYFLEFDGDIVHLNQLLNKDIGFHFLEYKCLNCEKNKKIFRQGFCYDCFQNIPSAGQWIMHPELSTAHLDKEDRDLAYEKKVQLQPHIVYLANSSNVKVGVTRKTQVPTRWIDQGAHEAIAILETPNRYLAGITEMELKKHVADKTNWRTMLKNEIQDKDLVEEREKLKAFIPEEAKAYYLSSSEKYNINFPVLDFPKQPKSINLEKNNSYKGKLMGIKGQYLMFEGDFVFNVRNSEGLVVEFELL